LAENLLDFVAKYEAEEHLVDMRWNNMHVQRQIKGLGLGELNCAPKPIEINFDEVKELPVTQSVSTTTGTTEYQNPFMRIDPFVTFQKTAEEQPA
jgi:hypothetical protein